MSSSDSASRSSAQSDQTVVSVAGSDTGGGARLTPAPDIVSQLPDRSAAQYRTQENRRDDVDSADRGNANLAADHGPSKPAADRGSGGHRGSTSRPADHEAGTVIVGSSMLRSPGVQESALGYPPPVLTQRDAPTTMHNFSMHPPRGLPAPPPAPTGPLPSRVAQLRVAHLHTSQSPKQQGTQQAQSVRQGDSFKVRLLCL
jgi:hypothetical protein